MEDAFSFVQDVQTLPDTAVRLQQTIIGLLKQTIECCTFVSRCASRHFLGKLTHSTLCWLAHLFSSGRVLDITSSQKIDEFEQSLANFKQLIESGVVLHTATIVSGKISQRIDEECG